MKEKFFVKKGCNLVIDRKLNDNWKKIKASKVLDYLDKSGLTWHKNLSENEVFVWEEVELIDGRCRVLTLGRVVDLDGLTIVSNVQVQTV